MKLNTDCLAMPEDEEDEVRMPARGLGSRKHVGEKRIRYRNEGQYARPLRDMAPSVKRALSVIVDLVGRGEPVTLAAINRGMGELPDHRGVWSVLRALKMRGLIRFHPAHIGKMEIPSMEAAITALRNS